MSMKNALILAAIAEAATGLALLIVPALVWQLFLGEQLTGVGIPVARRHRPDWFRDRLLAGSAARRHAHLRRIGHVVSGLPRCRRWFQRRPSVAGGRHSRDPDRAPRSRSHANSRRIARVSR